MNFQFNFQPFAARCTGLIPSDQKCYELWDHYGMFPHIRTHSLLVAQIATCLGQMAVEQGWHLDPQALRAAGLLHDLGKTYTVYYGGDHSSIGASWAMEHTGNSAIAQGIIHHVYWPGILDVSRHTLPLAIIYSDKRVKHDKIVSLQERMSDLIQRYGTSPERRRRIQQSFEQVQHIENQFSSKLKVPLHSYPFDCSA